MAGTIDRIIVVGALLLGGCSQPSQPVDQPSAATLRTSAAPDAVRVPDLDKAASLRTPWIGDVDGMRARRTIRVLVPLNRTYFFYDRLRERGFTVEFLREFERWLNRRYHTERTPTAVVFIPASREHFLADLAEGRGDIAAGGVAVTERRRQNVAFSQPIREGGFQIVVTGPGAPPLSRLEDLAGREVYLRGSSHYAEAVAALNSRFAKQGLPPIRIRVADPNLEDEDILELLSAGVVPITIVNRFLARFWATVLDDLNLHEDLVLADNQEIAYAVRKTSPQLRRLLDEFLADHRLGTSFGDTVWRRYLANNRWVKNPTATIDRKRVAATIDLFRRYAGDFDLDYLLLMAQAYQESQLRQDLRSPAGAVGVMQIKPATAAAPPILIRNVSTVANNIRAGAKYLRHLEDTRFADANLTPFNRQVFALAAYNAGAGRVASLRRAAADEGLDPDIWFENVELEAARAIGAETTTYVRNILKYYVTYQLTIRTGQPPVDR